MGCCCPKQSNESEDESTSERTRLLSNDQKSRFVESNISQGNLNLNQPLSSAYNSGLNFIEGYQQGENYDPNSINQNKIFQNNSNALSQENQIIDKILSEVIQVSAFDQRSVIQASDLMQFTSDQLDGGQDLHLKMKGFLEPNVSKQQLSLPDGVSAPFSVLSAQPPFPEDIRFINQMAQEAWNCVNNFSLNIPDNVAFDFKPVNI
ncbi:hypothetical protein BpHYR1_036073 [Brachionus plicatilis]|uniref:Late endosomal/lysosomal adaptor and MAPK and MTOR activator 1 n=1 Tax=Brachionus plicatilis TaxID=10195 RepID=A0A3M7R985_BRAPC|nr:hypothetical protein BpHYR1_036073 [Brachionus plicatilis]